MARGFTSAFRFIDEMTVLNDGGEFDKSFMEIYPAELELMKENEINTEGSFLGVGSIIKVSKPNEMIFPFIYAATFPL